MSACTCVVQIYRQPSLGGCPQCRCFDRVVTTMRQDKFMLPKILFSHLSSPPPPNCVALQVCLPLFKKDVSASAVWQLFEHQAYTARNSKGMMLIYAALEAGPTIQEIKFWCGLATASKKINSVNQTHKQKTHTTIQSCGFIGLRVFCAA